MNIVQQLIDGQAEIDRMRKEIDQVVHMLLGLLSHVDRSRIVTCASQEWIRFNSSLCVWMIYKANEKEIHVDCRLVKGNWQAYTTLITGYRTDYSLVKEVYSGLSVFVEGMFDRFPGLKDQVRPFLDTVAAKQ